MAPLLTHLLSLPTGRGITCQDITAPLQALVVNEAEERLLDDIAAFFAQLVPADRPYLHNDLHLRPGIPADEPRNAHSHLIALMLGNHLTLPVVEGQLGLGEYQSVLLVELDGPRLRQVLVQLRD
jgi:secondary thiamine-phosphate synthase enzyme